jgi:hypothetical protein
LQIKWDYKKNYVLVFLDEMKMLKLKRQSNGRKHKGREKEIGRE